MNKKILLLVLILSIFITGCVRAPPPVYNNNPTFNNITISNLLLSEPLYEDLRFPANNIRTQGAPNDPEQTIYGYAFDPDSEEDLYIIAQMPHSRKYGSNITAHWHWHTEDNTAGDVVWCIEYRWGNVEGVFDPIKNFCTVDSSQENSEMHLMSPEIPLDGTNKTSSSILKAKIYRDGGNTSDTYGADAYLLEFDLHYIIGQLGEIYHE